MGPSARMNAEKLGFPNIFVNMLEKIIEENPDLSFIKMDGLDSAIVGYDIHSERLIYSEAKIIEALQEDGMDYVTAYDWYTFNIQCSFISEDQPIIMRDYE